MKNYKINKMALYWIIMMIFYANLIALGYAKTVNYHISIIINSVILGLYVALTAYYISENN